MQDNSSTGYLLREIVRRFARAQRTLSACDDGASTVQCHVLNELLRHSGLTQQHLVERLGLDKGWISRAVDLLVRDGYISKQPDPTDRRCVRLGLTAAGHDRARKLDQTLNEHADLVLNAIPHAKQHAIRQSLECILNALEEKPAPNRCRQPSTPTENTAW